MENHKNNRFVESTYFWYNLGHKNKLNVFQKTAETFINAIVLTDCSKHWIVCNFKNKYCILTWKTVNVLILVGIVIKLF